MNKAKTKIAIISQSLGGGGAERFAGLLGQMLDSQGYEIHHIIIEDRIDFPHKGKVCNLGKETGFLKKISKALLMRNYLEKQNIDTIIENRPRNSFFRDWVSKTIFGKRKIVYVIHSYNLRNYMPESVFLAKWLYRDAEKLVCVSKAIEEKIIADYGFTNTTTIYNAIDLATISVAKPANLPEKFLLFFGRLDEKVKNFTLMLQAFCDSGIHEKGYKLVIMGNGPDEDYILDVAEKLDIYEFVRLIPFQENPFGYVREARFTLLTSHFEGFPMAILESLAIGTPVVSVDCLSGPSEIITNGQNGLLVPNNDSKALANAIARFESDQNLYDICKTNAAGSISHLSLENISRQWHQILT